MARRGISTGHWKPYTKSWKKRKWGHDFVYIPDPMDIVDWSRSPLHKCLVDGNENYGFPFVCLMENGHNTLKAQSP